MITRTIKARQTSRRKWYVHVPIGLRALIGKSRQTFEASKAANAFAKDLAMKRALIESRRQYAVIFYESGVGAAFAQSVGAKPAMPDLTLTDAFDRVIASKKQSGKRSNSVATLKCSLKSFAKACQKPAGEVVAADVESWLYAGDYTPKTRKGRLTDLNTAFGWLVQREMLAKNPAAAVESPAVAFKPVKILTVKNIRLLLENSRATDPALLPFLALVLFGGLRVAEARRCKAENLKNGVIDLGGESCKLNERRCIKITEQLAAWLAVVQFETVDVPKFFKRMVALQKASGVTIPPNALRHSFCSYHLELIGADATARAANNSTAMLNRHYLATVSAADAKEFASILPEICLQKTGVL